MQITPQQQLRQIEQKGKEQTIIHKLPPLVKITLTLYYIVAVTSVSAHDLSKLIGMILYPVIVAETAEISYKQLIHRIKPALPLILMTGIANIYINREPAIAIMGTTITKGLISYTTLTTKMILTVTAVLTLVATTPIEKINDALTEIKIPKFITMQITLTYRYITELIRETETMQKSYITRSGNTKNIKMKDLGAFIGTFLIKSIEKAKKVTLSMKCRGYNGKYYTTKKEKITKKEYMIATALFTSIAIPHLLNISILINNLITKIIK